MLRRLPFIIVTSLFATMAVAAIFNVYSTTEYTCLECRATLTKRHVCGLPLSRISRHPYTTTYLATNPSHLHSWRWCGTRQNWSLFTHTRACGRRHPIWSLPVEMQAKFSRLVSSAEMDATLSEIDSTSHEKAEAAVTRVYKRMLDSR